MDSKDYLSPKYNPSDWSIIQAPPEKTVSASPLWGWMIDENDGYSFKTAYRFSHALCDKLTTLCEAQLSVDIEEWIQNGASCTEIMPIIQQERIRIFVALSAAHTHNTTLFNKLLTKVQLPLVIFEWALRNCNLHALTIAIKNGIDINTRIHTSQETALMHWASSETHAITEIVPLGANLNDQDEEGRTALMYAITFLRLENASHLLSYGVNPYLQDITKRTALDYTHAIQDPRFRKLIVDGIRNYKCFICSEYRNKNLPLLPCTKNHLDFFICSDCLTNIKAKDNTCPLCFNKLS